MKRARGHCLFGQICFLWWLQPLFQILKFYDFSPSGKFVAQLTWSRFSWMLLTKKKFIISLRMGQLKRNALLLKVMCFDFWGLEIILFCLIRNTTNDCLCWVVLYYKCESNNGHLTSVLRAHLGCLLLESWYNIGCFTNKIIIIIWVADTTPRTE